MRVRKAQESDATALAHVLVDSMRSAHRDQVPEASLMKLTYEESERNWARALREINEAAESEEWIFIAEDDAENPVGVAMCGPERNSHPLYAGEVYVLYVLPAYHRQGIGRRLLEAVVGQLIRQEMPSLLIRVLKANAPARRFYEVLGGQLVLEEQQVEEDGTVLDLVAYGWTDASILLPRF